MSGAAAPGSGPRVGTGTAGGEGPRRPRSGEEAAPASGPQPARCPVPNGHAATVARLVVLHRCVQLLARGGVAR